MAKDSRPPAKDGDRPPRKVMSNRGNMVDFDLLKIKQTIASQPQTKDVLARERFIDKKRRRTSTRKVSEMLAQQAENQSYAKDMIDSQRRAKAIEDANLAKEDNLQLSQLELQDTMREDVSLEQPIVLDESSQPQPPITTPRRYNRRTR